MAENEYLPRQCCLALVSRKVALYEAQLADDGSDPLWTDSCVVGYERQD
ncbi:hypothetical protein [Saccharopolyspora antimicrobica]|nr:hypothetical protein [Saccharopolyspora antimicrobica]